MFNIWIKIKVKVQ